MKKLLCACISFLLMQSLVAQVTKMDQATWDAINTQVALTYAANQLKGLSVAVVYGGDIAYANAFGLKNEDGDPFTLSTKSLLASVSKTITAVLAMRLVQNGDIDLDDPISLYLPPEYEGIGITIRHLLAHQSGIAHYSNCPGGYSGPFNASDSYDEVMDCGICMSPPGSGTLYTTFGTTLLGVIISNVAFVNYAGSSYQGLYEAWIRGPGGLTTLTPEFDNSDPSLAEGELGEIYWNDIGWKLPAGGFISNITDLAKFAIGLLDNTFITRATYEMMMVEQTTSGSPNVQCGELENNNYGLGFSLGGSSYETFRTSHNGVNSHGYSAHLSIYPNSNAAVVMLSNSDAVTDELNNLRVAITDLILCPDSRDFTNDISWNEPRVFEGEVIKGRSEITTSYNGEYIFDAESFLRLLPGFRASEGKKFRAIVSDGCGGSVLAE